MSQFSDLSGEDQESSIRSSLPPTTTVQPSSTVGTLKDVLRPYSNSFVAAHVNAQSLPAHFAEFQSIFGDSLLHSIFVSETWLSDSLPTSIVQLEGYTLYRRDRNGRRAGGCAIYVRNDIQARVLSMSNDTYVGETEFLILELKIKFQKLLVATVYRPPGNKFTNFEDEISKLLPLYEHTLIMGDFNYDLLSSKPEVNEFREKIDTYNLKAAPLNATHYTKSSHSLLDIILTTNPNNLLSCGQLEAPGLSRHHLIYASYALLTPKFEPRRVTYRDIKSINVAALAIDTIAYPWDNIYLIPDVNEKLKIFNQLLLQLLDKYAPCKTKIIKRPPSPWISNEILTLMSERDAAYKRHCRMLKQKSDLVNETWEEYRKLRNRCTQEIRNAKIKFAHKLNAECRRPQQLWNSLKALGITDNVNNSSHINTSLDDLNAHFCQSNNFDAEVKKTTINKIMNLSDERVKDSFSFSCVTPAEVEATIQKIRSNAIGVDEIPISFIKLILPYIIQPFTNIINQSLMSGIYPNIWKRAHVLPLPKKSNPTSKEDYRPISILPALSKVLERIVQNQVLNHLNNYSLLDPLQSAYKKHHSTNTALIKVTNDIKMALDRGQLSLLILLDQSKAFQSIDHDIFLSKLTHFFGFSTSAITWTKSYLVDRHQRVKDVSNTSSWLSVNAGVPQGSILGGLFFSLYINDLPTSITHSKYHLYADDLQLYVSFNKTLISSGVQRANEDIASVSEWAKANALQINPNKSKCILIGKANLEPTNIPHISINNASIPLCTSVKNLGIMMNSNLTWSDHINSIVKKAFYALHFLNRLRDLLPERIKKTLTQTLVLSHVDYCDSLISGLTMKQNQKLQRIQNACVRYVYNIRRSEHLTAYFKKLKWLKIKERRELHQLTLLHKIIKTGEPSYLASTFRPTHPSHMHNTRSRNNLTLTIPKHRTSSYSNSFLVSAIRSWNKLPTHLRNCSSVSSFKKGVQNLLMQEH